MIAEIFVALRRPAKYDIFFNIIVGSVINDKLDLFYVKRA